MFTKVLLWILQRFRTAGVCCQKLQVGVPAPRLAYIAVSEHQQTVVSLLHPVHVSIVCVPREIAAETSIVTGLSSAAFIRLKRT